MKYIVTALGPIDRLPPGADVTGRYDAETLKRLIAEGYVEPVEDEAEGRERWRRSKGRSRKSS